MVNSPVAGQVIDFDIFGTRTEADEILPMGALLDTSNGRDVYRHGKVGASNISKGKLQLAPAPVANHMGLVLVTDQAIGDKSVTATLGGTAATLNQYAEGKLVINAGTGLGQTLSISGHPAQATTTGNLTVKLFERLIAAIDNADSKVTLVHNTYNGLVEAASKTRTAAGVALVSLLAGDYGFVKTKGIIGTLIGSAATLGGRLTSDGSTAGAVTDNTDVTTVQTEVEVGQASVVAGVTAEYNPIMVSID